MLKDAGRGTHSAAAPADRRQAAALPALPFELRIAAYREGSHLRLEWGVTGSFLSVTDRDVTFHRSTLLDVILDCRLEMCLTNGLDAGLIHI